MRIPSFCFLHIWTQVGLLLLCCMTSGCQQRSMNSHSKSLENLAADSDIKYNLCHGSKTEITAKETEIGNILIKTEGIDKNISNELSTEVALALTALPIEFLRAFRGFLGKIIVTPDADKICGKAAPEQTKKTGESFLACGSVLPFGSLKVQKEYEGVSIVLAPSINAIRHLTVRSFAYLFTQLIAKRYWQLAKDGTVSQVNPLRFTELQYLLAASFLSDVDQSKVFSLENFSYLFGDQSDAKVKKSLDDFLNNSAKSPFEGLTTNPAILTTFFDQVTADSFDSYYCNAAEEFDSAIADKIKDTGDLSLFKNLHNSRSLMESFFPKTYSAFSQTNQYLQTIAKEFAEVAGIMKASQQPQGGFYLEGPNQIDPSRIDQVSAATWSAYNSALRHYHEQRERVRETWNYDAEYANAKLDYEHARRTVILEQNPSAQLNALTTQKTNNPGFLEYAEGAAQGFNQGMESNGQAVVGAAKGLGGFAYQAVTDPSGAVDSINEGFDGSVQRIATRLDEIDNHTSPGSTQTFGYVSTFSKELPFIGPLARSAENAANEINGGNDVFTSEHISTDQLIESQERGVTGAASGVMTAGAIRGISSAASAGGRLVTGLTRGIPPPGPTTDATGGASASGYVQAIEDSVSASASAPATQIGVQAASSQLTSAAPFATRAALNQAIVRPGASAVREQSTNSGSPAQTGPDANGPYPKEQSVPEPSSDTPPPVDDLSGP